MPGSDAVVPQPPPRGDGAVVLDYVIRDLQERAEHGKAKYGTYLRTNNGRDALVDLYQEALDQVMYLCQLILERGIKCVWSQGYDGEWMTSCKQVYEFNDGTPEQNGVRFCHHCGRSVTFVMYSERTDDEEDA